MRAGPNYDLTNQWRFNSDEARDDPASRKEYVEKWADRVGVTFEVAWYWFCTDQLAAISFAKDPRRQTAHEKIAASWIETIPGVRNFRNLPSSGPDALYVQNGKIMGDHELANKNTPKSIDFIWDMQIPVTGEVISFYAAHKFTSGPGGSQENQYKDLRDFTYQAAELTRDCGVRILSLADGPFYSMKPSGEKLSRMSILKQAASIRGGHYSRAMTTADLPDYLSEVVSNSVSDITLSQPEDAIVRGWVDRIQGYA